MAESFTGTPLGESVITISMKEYERLVEVDEFMDALERAGVDNWEGYEIACRVHGGEENDDY